jgi:hypothetical protein
MADMRRKRTVLLRADPQFKKWIDEMSRFKSYQEKDRITPSRLTQAIYNQYLKYPNLLDEIKLSKLGKWKSK